MKNTLKDKSLALKIKSLMMPKIGSVGDSREHIREELADQARAGQINKEELPGGKGDDTKDKDFNPKEVGMGHQVEGEHTRDKGVAAEITRDHLTEDPEYYSKLKDAGLADELQKNENPLRSIADDYNKKANLPHIQHMSQLPQLDPNLAGKLAQAHTDMRHDPHHPEVKKAYTALVGETLDQYHHLLDHGYKFSPIQPGQANPYPTSKHMIHDVEKNKHLWYFPTDQGFGSDPDTQDHPLLQKVKTKDGKEVPANDIFRAVHDIFGHAKEGNGFGPRGEEAAWSHHMQMFTPDAQKALTAETRLQNHWVNWGPHKEHNKAHPDQTIYAPQKAGLPPTWALTTQHLADTKKSEELGKGAMKRVAPFNPSSVPKEDRFPVESWTGGYSGGPEIRDEIPEMPFEAKMRGLNKLARLTDVRVNANGEREFLLHRGMGGNEFDDALNSDGTVHHGSNSSWTPKLKMARDFSKDYAGMDIEEHYAMDEEDRPTEPILGGVVSAWINEKHIHHIPNAIGSLSPDVEVYDESDLSLPHPKEQNRRGEHEIIVKPLHRSQIHAANPIEVQKNASGEIIATRLHGSNQGYDPIHVNEKINRRSQTGNLFESPKPKLKKSEELEKGSAQRRAKFNPITDVSSGHRNKVRNWVMDAVDRNFVPKLEGGARYRALHKLTSQALTRMNKDTGEREYLLFRGKTEHDHQNKDEMKGLLSFTPDPDVAHDFNRNFKSAGFSRLRELFHPTHPINVAVSDYMGHVNMQGHDEQTKKAADHINNLKDKFMGGVFASWVPESAVHHVPNAIGDKLHGDKMIPNYHQEEQEVIVNADHPKIKFHKFGTEHIDMLKDLYQDHVASVVAAQVKPIKKFEDIAKMYAYKGTYRAESHDPEGMPHPEKPYVKATSKSGGAVWAYKPEVASQHEKRFMDGFNRTLNSSLLSPKGKQHFYKLSRQVLSDPDRHVIATGEHGNQSLRLRHLMHAMEGREGNFMEETSDGIKITSIRHSGRSDKLPEIHSWHFDGESLNFLGDQNKGKL